MCIAVSCSALVHESRALSFSYSGAHWSVLLKRSLMTAWCLLNDCLMSSWWLLDDFLMTAQLLCTKVECWYFLMAVHFELFCWKVSGKYFRLELSVSQLKCKTSKLKILTINFENDMQTSFLLTFHGQRSASIMTVHFVLFCWKRAWVGFKNAWWFLLQLNKNLLFCMQICIRIILNLLSNGLLQYAVT